MTIIQGIDYMILGLILTRCQFSGGISCFMKDSKMRSERSADAEFRRLLYKIVFQIFYESLFCQTVISEKQIKNKCFSSNFFFFCFYWTGQLNQTGQYRLNGIRKKGEKVLSCFKMFYNTVFFFL